MFISWLVKYLCSEDLSFDEEAVGYIFAVTNGHPGAVHSIVPVLFQVCAGYFFKHSKEERKLTILGVPQRYQESMYHRFNRRPRRSLSRQYRESFRSTRQRVSTSLIPPYSSLNERGLEDINHNSGQRKRSLRHS